jgi:sporulation protein YlmC with PRC-barrel domain
MKLEDLHLGASVISLDGRKLGSLSRFVINKETLALTHIVVDTGILRSGTPLWEGGWGLSHDRVVPLGVVQEADSREVHVAMTADEFRDHSADYVAEHFDAIPDEHPGWPDASDVRRIAASLPGEPGPYLLHEVAAIAPNEVDIRRDSPVWRLNPHEKIGEVERVIFDEETRKVTGLVVRRGHFFSHDVILPIADIVEVVGEIVRVQLDDAALARLAPFRADG